MLFYPAAQAVVYQQLLFKQHREYVVSPRHAGGRYHKNRRKLVIMLQKILIIIMGVLTAISGIYVTANPELALPLLGAMMAVGLCLFSVTAILTWIHRRQSGEADGFSLFLAILGFIFSLMFLGNIWAQLLSAEMMFYMSLIFMVVEGIVLIVDAFRMRRLKDESDPALREIGSSWGWILAAGILMAIAGVFALCHPLGAMVVNGIYMGIELIVAGVAAIVIAIRMK